MGKRPSFQFYTGDWKKDPKLSLCAPQSRGIWIDLLCGIHDLDLPAGSISGTQSELSQVCRCTKKQMGSAIKDLRRHDAATVTDDGNGLYTIVCRRMALDWDVRDKDRKRKRASGEVPDKFQGNSSPSSSSLSSSSSSSPSGSPSNEGEGEPNSLGEDIQQDLEGLELPTAGPDVMARWNPLAAAVGLPEIGRWTDKLDGHYRQTIGEIGSAAFWAALKDRLPLLDEFARGLTPKWKGVTFRWLCESRDNFAKFEAGEYDDVKAAKQAARGKAAKSGQQKALADMKRWRDGSEADRARYEKRLAMYRTKDSLGKLPAENVWILGQLGEALDD